MKGLEAAIKHMRHFDTANTITVMYNKVENELYRWELKEKETKDYYWMVTEIM
jgi:hypothetical protein